MHIDITVHSKEEHEDVEALIYRIEQEALDYLAISPTISVIRDYEESEDE